MAKKATIKPEEVKKEEAPTTEPEQTVNPAEEAPAETENKTEINKTKTEKSKDKLSGKDPKSDTQTPVAPRPKTKTELMKEALDKQPKVSIIIPLEGKEKVGAVETVQLNGYTYIIKKGEYVSVPKQVAQIIMDSQQQTAQAIAEALKRVPDSERMEFNNSD